MANGYFPGKKPAKRSAIITPRTAQELQIAAMPRMSRQARQALHDVPPLRVGGADLVEGADRIMRTPAEHQAALKVARVYLRVSTDEQNLERQEAIIAATRAAGFYVAGIYREKASGARADRPELERMIHDLQPGEAVVAEKIDQGRTLGYSWRDRPLRHRPGGRWRGQDRAGGHAGPPAAAGPADGP